MPAGHFPTSSFKNDENRAMTSRYSSDLRTEGENGLRARWVATSRDELDLSRVGRAGSLEGIQVKVFGPYLEFG